MIQVNPAVFGALQAHIMEHVSFKARAVTLLEVKEDEQIMQLLKENPQQFEQLTESMIANKILEFTQALQELEAGNAQPDPLVALKQRELDLRAMDIQRRAGEFAMTEQRRADEFEEQLDLDKMKREDAEFQASERIRVADEKVDILKRKQNEQKTN